MAYIQKLAPIYMMTAEIENDLLLKGWITINDISSKVALFNYAELVGIVIPHPNGEMINTLKANDGLYSCKGSFSNRFGYSSFPLHTDTAFWSIPARYMMLCSIHANEHDTLIYSSLAFLSSLSEEELNLAKSAVFVVKTYHKLHYTSMIFNEFNSIGFRYDPCCMIPVNKAAKRIITIYDDFFNQHSPERVKWCGNSAILLDNWKMLHGRSIVNQNNQREINRIYIKAR